MLVDGLVLSTSYYIQAKQKKTDPAKENACHDEGSQHPQILGPLYEELHQESILEHRDDLVELQENVAYGPIAK